MATASISLKALTHNLERIRAYLEPETKLLTALKANAYGHGAASMAKHLESKGVNWFGVATTSEALELRFSGSQANILIFAPVYMGLEELIDLDISLPVVDEASIQAVEQAAKHKKARVHLKVDTGMGRLGQAAQASVDLARQIDQSARLELEGVWTHFAASDDEDRAFTEGQIDHFQRFLVAIKREGIQPKLRHASNSSAIFAYPEIQLDMVRPGIAVYGYHSSPFTESLEPGLIPVLTLSAPITFIKEVKAGTSISYSSLWRAPRDTKIATVRIGYADGYPRLLTGKAEVLIQNQLRPVAGRICMDQLMVDVAELDVSVGDRVTLFGPELSAETLAGRIGTISYELLTSLSARVKRVYTN
ncbi:MAG: alanine racemase [Trueperaceae bacterium]|nr:alanine racemase [Trueperaceae bacterium]